VPKYESTSGPKQQVSFNISVQLLTKLKELAGKHRTLNEAVREVLADHFEWYGLPYPVVVVLLQDAEKRGKKTQRDYVVDLLMKRYTEIVVEREKTAKK
jgi:hypothetical protein